MIADTPEAEGGLRADARRNRARVLDVALETFATEGMAVTLGEIARRAGVGAGTVYRHFPSKERLFEEVLARRTRELVTLGRVLAEDGADQGVRFFAFFDEVVAQAAVNRALCDGFHAISGRETKLSAELFAEYLSVLGGLLTAAQASGDVRDDVDTMDVHALIWGAAQIEATRKDTGGGRHLTRVIAEGLRADATKPAAVERERNETLAGVRDETRGGGSVAGAAGSEVAGGLAGDVAGGRAGEVVREAGSEVAGRAATCAQCGKVIEASRTGRPARFCGPACRQKAHRAARR
ncbi:TetR/AcrR family transcriptional regulator [Phytomonospora endophytica]|uniref:AcrR family transcriptional regulator n=1 Tax=Phytomonospora endophytica TaxID=714109 RepID=A0A841FT14_9ACTN|nr:TetR/AcrR family transcriptional regulator [Phytomonospora endophytica]MBB6039435.1 AcrR family transcriptional regulator [Phytomonospora endophytica]GIG70162.1 hypothetical protein Pen01_64570 [Phytomonospora endophytica]